MTAYGQRRPPLLAAATSEHALCLSSLGLFPRKALRPQPGDACERAAGGGRAGWGGRLGAPHTLAAQLSCLFALVVSGGCRPAGASADSSGAHAVRLTGGRVPRPLSLACSAAERAVTAEALSVSKLIARRLTTECAFRRAPVTMGVSLLDLRRRLIASALVPISAALAPASPDARMSGLVATLVKLLCCAPLSSAPSQLLEARRRVRFQAPLALVPPSLGLGRLVVGDARSRRTAAGVPALVASDDQPATGHPAQRARAARAPSGENGREEGRHRERSAPSVTGRRQRGPAVRARAAAPVRAVAPLSYAVLAFFCAPLQYNTAPTTQHAPRARRRRSARAAPARGGSAPGPAFGGARGSTASVRCMAACDECDDERLCRYCFGGPEDGPLISPCKCSGGQKWVHLECLRRWQRMVLVSWPPYAHCRAHAYVRSAHARLRAASRALAVVC